MLGFHRPRRPRYARQGHGGVPAAGAAAGRPRERFSRGQEDLSGQHHRDHLCPWRSALEGLLPAATTEEWDAEYRANNEAIFFCSLGAAIQNLQLGVAAEGLTSAWLSGGGEDKTNRELAEVLGYPTWMKAYGTIPIGYPAVDQNRRYRRPLAQLLHWNGYQPRQYRQHAQVDFYESTLRPFAMYREDESMSTWPDRNEMLGDWKEAFTGDVTNPDGALEPEADFSKPRVIGQATKRRRPGDSKPA
jgi:nitroreductase